MSSSIRTALRTALTQAMKDRDRAAVTAYRSALGAIDNAEAVVPESGMPRAGAVEQAAVGVGAAETARRALTEDDNHAIVRHEVEERAAAADLLDATHPERAAALRAEAALLDGLLHE